MKSPSEWYLQGRLPLHTLRADIDYGFTEAHTTYASSAQGLDLSRRNSAAAKKRSPNRELPRARSKATRL